MTSQPTLDPASTVGLPLRDRARLEWYLTRFDWAMQDYPRKELKRIKADLRSDLTVAALDVGTTRALADVGHPRVLAERYVTELGRRLPRWTTGSLAAGAAVGVVMFLMMFYSLGAMDTLEALGGGTVSFDVLGGTTTLTSTADEISASLHLGWGWAALLGGIAVVSFLLGSRVWRAF